ncbi:MAG: hypothetical protein OEY28_11685, partial [Nitrospira sp.]|nr:hypothetical protein [Nitrospira sp.]
MRVTTVATILLILSAAVLITLQPPFGQPDNPLRAQEKEAEPEPIDAWAKIKTLRGSFSFNIADTRSESSTKDGATTTGYARVIRSAEVSFVLERERIGKRYIRWKGKTNGSCSINDKMLSKTTSEKGERALGSEWIGSNSFDGSVEKASCTLSMDRRDGVYRLSVRFPDVPCTTYGTAYVRGDGVEIGEENKKGEDDIDFDVPTVDDQPIPATAGRLSGNETFKFPDFIVSLMQPKDARVFVSWYVGVEDEEKPRAVLSGIEKDWLPEPDKTLELNVKLENTEAEPEEIRYTLFEVSRERGRCLNDKEKNSDDSPDFELPEIENGALGYKIEKKGEDTFIATTDHPEIGKGKLLVKCHDYGAWAKVKAEVKVFGEWLEAEIEGGGRLEATIPVDDDGNHIADKWEFDNGFYGKPPEWDEDSQPTGQVDNGDAVSYFEEYRGFFVLEGGRKHKRLDPKVKEIFCVDKGKLLDPELWKGASGITVLKVDTSMVRGASFEEPDRIVDFCAGYGDGPTKWCFHVHKQEGMEDPLHGKPVSTFGYAMAGDCPRDCEYVYIFVDRMDAWVRKKMKNYLEKIVNDPESKEAKAWGETGLPTFLVEKALESFKNEENVKRIVNELIALVTVHEAGHACGIDHHGSKKEGRGATSGVDGCPTRYFGDDDELKIVVIELLFPQKEGMSNKRAQFCKE